MATPRHSVSVAAVIIRDDGRALAIQRRDNAKWEPPGGVLELEETIEDGLCREVREETGLEIAVEQLSGIYKNLERGIVALVFRCRPRAGAPASTPEAVAVDWLDQEEVRQRMDPAYAVRMLDALDVNPVAAIRAHDGVTVVN